MPRFGSTTTFNGLNFTAKSIPFATISPSVNSTVEGNLVAFTITSNQASATLYWRIKTSASTATSADFAGSVTSGSFVTDSSGSAIFTVTTVNDLIPNGSTTFVIEILIGSVSGPVIGTSNTITITDSSTVTFGTITPTPITITDVVNNPLGYKTTIEGATYTFNFATTNIAVGTLLYVHVTGVGGNPASSSDFNNVSQPAGSFTVAGTSASGTGSFTWTIFDDNTSETTNFRDSYTVEVKPSSSYSSTTLATLPDVAYWILDATASFTSQPTSVSEGSSGSFTVSTNMPAGQTLYWTVLYGTSSASDFSSTSGSATVVAGGSYSTNTISFTVPVTTDAVTAESGESFQVQIRLGSTSGRVLTTSNSISIIDTSTGYSFGTIPTSINEGSAGTFNVTAYNIANGTVIYWTINAGTASLSDFSATSGSFTINSNAGSFTVTPNADYTSEGAETFTVSLRTGSTSGPVVATSNSVTVNDTSTSPTYAFGTIPSSLNENQTGTWNVVLTGVAPSTTLYYAVMYLDGGSAYEPTTSDFPSSGTGAGFGSFTTSGTLAAGTGSFTITPRADWTTEGQEQFRVRLYTDSGLTNVVATSGYTQLIDTSTNATATVTPSVSSVNEGSSVTFNVTFTGFPTPATSGTAWYDILAVSGTVNVSDFSAGVSDLGNGLIGGSFSVGSAGTGSFSVTLTSDSMTEGAESFQVRVRPTGSGGYVAGTSSTVTINDTSTTPITYSVAPNVSSVNEGGTVTWTVTTTGVSSGTVLYWKVNLAFGTDTTDFPDIANMQGSVTINSNTGSFTTTIKEDLTTEGSETLYVQIWTNSTRTQGQHVAQSSNVTINDTSTTPTGEFTVTGSINDVTQNWTVPAGVTSISIICIGGGGGAGAYGLQYNTAGTLLRRYGGGGGGGGALAYRNSYSVTPGTTLTITAGKYGTGGGSSASGGGTIVPNRIGPNGNAGGVSKVVYGSTTVIEAGPGTGGIRSNYVVGTTVSGGTGGTATSITNVVGSSGGAGGTGIGASSGTTTGITGGDGGGGGAGGYTGSGGRGGNATTSTSQASGVSSSGGGGGGGAGGRNATPSSGILTLGAGAGGGVGALGSGTNGAGGIAGSINGKGGSGGTDGASGTGGNYGGGGAQGGRGGAGYVRIIWPGFTRGFPSAAT